MAKYKDVPTEDLIVMRAEASKKFREGDHSIEVRRVIQKISEELEDRESGPTQIIVE